METLRFLMVTTFYPPYHLGGDAVHVQYLAEALSRAGHEVHVEHAPAAYRLKRRGLPSTKSDDDGVQVHPIPSPWGRLQPAAAYALGQSRSVTRHHEELMHDLRPDVTHFHNISLLGAGVVERHHSETNLYTAHDYWVRCPRSDLFKFGRYPCDHATCVRCGILSRRPPQLWRDGNRRVNLESLDFAIAPSRFALHALEGEFDCPLVHLPNFAPDKNPDGTTWEPKDYYLYVGAHDSRKGVRELASAALLGPEAPSVVFVGLGEEEEHLRQLEREGRADIRVKGWVSAEELARLYRHARGLIVPSLWHENAPLVAIEALSWGAPLLVSRRGGLEELIGDGDAGTSFEPTAGDIFDAVGRFEETESPERMRDRARLAYTTHHHPGWYLERYMSIVREGEEAIERMNEGMLTPGSLDSTAP